MTTAGPHQIWVGNIPYETTEEELYEVLARVAPVVSVRIRYDKDTGQSKGFAFCEFEDSESCALAVKHLHGYLIGGRPMRLDFCSGEQTRAVLNDSFRPTNEPSLSAVLGGKYHDEKAGASQVTNKEEIPLRVEVAQIVESLTAAQLFYILGHMQKLVLEAPDHARALLREHPSLCYALLHAQFICGMVDEPFTVIRDSTTIANIKNDQHKRQQETIKQLYERESRLLEKKESFIYPDVPLLPDTGEIGKRLAEASAMSAVPSSHPLPETQSGSVPIVVGPVITRPNQASRQPGSEHLSYGLPQPTIEPMQHFVGALEQAAPPADQSELIEQILAHPEILEQIMSVAPELMASWSTQERAEILAIRAALRERGINA